MTSDPQAIRPDWGNRETRQQHHGSSPISPPQQQQREEREGHRSSTLSEAVELYRAVRTQLAARNPTPLRNEAGRRRRRLLTWWTDMWTFRANLVLCFLAATVTGLENCTPKSCRRKSDIEKPVCGSDGVTYPNRCHLERARCRDPTLTLRRRSVCREPNPCATFAAQQPSSTFKPQCRPDGSYAPLQCHQGVGACWCVTPEGRPVPHTSNEWSEGAERQQKCGNRKKVTRRRSQHKQHRKRCKQHDKAVFNNNLLKLFYTEWSRETSGDVAGKHSSSNETDKIVLFWKFSSMDANDDGVLDRPEYKDLQRMVRVAVRPKRCSKNFAKACDMDGDQIITRQEWNECLTRDGIDDGRGHSSPDVEEEEEEDDGEDPFSARPSPPHGVLSGETRVFGSSGGLSTEESSSDMRDEDATDCLSDRQTAQSEQHANKRYELYVPECTPDGRYQKIQCYKSAGYCWCVHEDTGKNIPGTSVKNGTPNCDHLTSSAVRPMKGCPDDKKRLFLRDLMQFLHNRMAANGTGITSPWKASKEEQAATWSFVVFDKNKNKLMDRNEWKAFKELMISQKTLKRCGKKLPRYCDINKDRQISITEWLDCLNVQQQVSGSGETNSTPGSIRAGKNPLSVLMED